MTANVSAESLRLRKRPEHATVGLAAVGLRAEYSAVGGHDGDDSAAGRSLPAVVAVMLQTAVLHLRDKKIKIKRSRK